MQKIVDKFKIEGNFKSCCSFGDGLINNTYLIETNKTKYVLQKINGDVFEDIPTLTANKVIIAKHIQNKLNARTLEFVPTRGGLYYFEDENGEYWNMSKFIENTLTFSRVSSPQLAFEAGKAIANFQHYLIDLDSDGIADTIPDFHNASKRIEDFEYSIKQDAFDRKRNVGDLIIFAKKHKDLIIDIDEKIKNNIIPKRIVHNDTKISNILFDKNSRAICMIDFDTCMRGSILHDFGDALRSGTNTGTEDNPENVSMSLALFEGYAEGYLSIAKRFLCKLELENLAYSGILITYEQFIRFLSDYLNGDSYYKIKHPTHNLERSKSQAKLLKSMLSQMQETKEIIRKYSTN